MDRVVGCEQQALQPLALAVESVHACRAIAHTRVFGTISPCLIFSKNFNIMSALSAHQPQTLLQIIDSREGLF